MEPLSNWLTGKRTLPRPGDILKQITAELEKIHSSGKGHGKIDASNVFLNQVGTQVVSLGEESQLSYYTQTQKDDIFYLGCLFYQVITGGFHPFGQPEHINKLKDLNLYDLSECGSNKNLLPSDVLCDKMEQLINKMISHDENHRPTIEEIRKQHPIFWTDETIVEYLRNTANKEHYSGESWNNALVFSDEDDITTVDNILQKISQDEGPFNWNTRFPELLNIIYSKVESKASYRDEKAPQRISNLLVANSAYGNVKGGGIERQCGALGGEFVHVLKVENESDKKYWKNVHYFNCANLLKCQFLVEDVKERFWVAVEPFDETLESWIRPESISKTEDLKDIMSQITQGLTYLHSKNIFHGNISMKNLVIFPKNQSLNGTTKVKIAKFPSIDGQNSITTQMERPKSQDVKALGQILEEMFKRTKMKMPLDGQHLVQSLIDDSPIPPPCEAILYHPFFWFDEEIISFLQSVDEFCEDNKDGTTFLSAKTKEKLTYFITLAQEDNSAIKQWIESNLDVILEIWLIFQFHKSQLEEYDLGSFYYSNYNFCYDDYMSTNESYEEPNATSNTAKSLIGAANYEKKHSSDQGRESRSDSFIQSINIFMAACTKMVADVQYFIKNGTGINVTDDLKRSALHFAAAGNSVEVVEYLLRKGIDAKLQDMEGNTALHFAAAQIHFEDDDLGLHIVNQCQLVQCLLSKGKIDPNVQNASGQSALHLSVERSLLEVVKIILQNGANPDKTDKRGIAPLNIAVSFKSLTKERCEIVQLLLIHGANPNGNGDGRTLFPLHAILASSGSLDLIKMLINYNADASLVDKSNFSVLHTAVSRGTEEVVRYLLEKCNALKDVNPCDDRGGMLNGSLLHTAAWFNYATILRILIDKCKDKISAVNIRDENKETPLMYAASRNSYEAAKVLIDSNADISLKGVMSRTALHMAAAVNGTKVAHILIEKNPEAVNDKDELNLRPLHYAEFCDSNDFIKLLKKQKRISPSPSSKNLKPEEMRLIHNIWKRPSYFLHDIDIQPGIIYEFFNRTVELRSYDKSLAPPIESGQTQNEGLFKNEATKQPDYFNDFFKSLFTDKGENFRRASFKFPTLIDDMTELKNV